MSLCGAMDLFTDCPSSCCGHNEGRTIDRPLVHRMAEATDRPECIEIADSGRPSPYAFGDDHPDLPLDTYLSGLTRIHSFPNRFFITESHSGVIGRVVLDGSTVHPLQTWEATSLFISEMSLRDFLTTRPESTIYSGLVNSAGPSLKTGSGISSRYRPSLLFTRTIFFKLHRGLCRFCRSGSKRIDPTDYNPWIRWKRF